MPSPSQSTVQPESSSTGDDVRDAERVLADAADYADRNSRPESTLSKAVQSVDSAGNTLSDNKGVELLVEGVNSLLEGLPSLVKALDEISKIHPFVGSKCSSADGKARMADMFEPQLL